MERPQRTRFGTPPLPLVPIDQIRPFFKLYRIGQCLGGENGGCECLVRCPCGERVGEIGEGSERRFRWVQGNEYERVTREDEREETKCIGCFGERFRCSLPLGEYHSLFILSRISRIELMEGKTLFTDLNRRVYGRSNDFRQRQEPIDQITNSLILHPFTPTYSLSTSQIRPPSSTRSVQEDVRRFRCSSSSGECGCFGNHDESDWGTSVSRSRRRGGFVENGESERKFRKVRNEM